MRATKFPKDVLSSLASPIDIARMPKYIWTKSRRLLQAISANSFKFYTFFKAEIYSRKKWSCDVIFRTKRSSACCSRKNKWIESFRGQVSSIITERKWSWKIGSFLRVPQSQSPIRNQLQVFNLNNQTLPAAWKRNVRLRVSNFSPKEIRLRYHDHLLYFLLPSSSGESRKKGCAKNTRYLRAQGTRGEKQYNDLDKRVEKEKDIKMEKKSSFVTSSFDCWCKSILFFLRARFLVFKSSGCY